MRRIRKGFIPFIVFLATLFSIMALIPAEKAYAVSNPNMTVDYFIVSKTDYENYYSQFEDDANGMTISDWINDIADYMQAADNRKEKTWGKSDVYDYYELTFEQAFNKVFRPDLDDTLSSKKIESITSGDVSQIVIVPIVSISSYDGTGAQVVLDMTSYADSVSFIPFSIKGYTAQNKYENGQAQLGNAETAAKGEAFLFLKDTKTSLGGIAVTLKSGISSNVEIGLTSVGTKQGNILFQVQDGADSTGLSTGYDRGNHPDHFVDNSIEITSSQPTSDSFLSELKVNGTSVKSTEVHTDGSNLYEYSYGETGGVGSEIDIEVTGNVKATVVATVQNSGTVTSMTYGPTLDTITANTASTTGEVDMKKAKTGSYLYVQIKTKASDGDASHTSTITLKIKTKKSTKNTLSSIDITSTVPSGYSYISGESQVNKIDEATPTSTPADGDGTGFVPSKSNNNPDYCITIGEEADSITLEPVVANTMSVKVISDSRPTPTALTLNKVNASDPDSDLKGSITLNGNDIEHGDIITVEVTAQDGSSVRTYKFKVNRKARNIKLSSLTVEADGTSLGNFDVDTQTFTMTATLPVAYTTAAVTVTANVDPVNKIRSSVTIKSGRVATYGSTSTNDRTNGTAANATVTYATNLAGAAQTAYFEIVVTNDFNHKSSAITIEVERKEADNTISLKFPDSTAEAEISTYNWTSRSWTTTGDSSNTTQNYTAYPSFASNTYTYAQMPYGTRYVTVHLVPEKETTKYYSDSARTNEITDTDYQFTLWSTPTAAGATPSFVIYATTEAGNAQFSLKFPYEAADTNTGVTYKIRAYNAKTNVWDTISPQPREAGAPANRDVYVFDTEKYVSGQFEIFDVVTTKSTTDVFTSTSNTNYNNLTSDLFSGSKAYAIDYDTPVYLTAVSQAQGTAYETFTIITKTVEDQDNKIKNIKIFNSTDTVEVEIPFTFNADITSYTVKTGNATSTTTDYAIYVDFDVTHVRFEVEKNSTKSSIIVGNSYLGSNKLNYSTATNDVANPFEFQLKSKDGTAGKKYTIHVYRKPGATDQYLTSLNINSINMYAGPYGTYVLETYDKTTNSMDFIMPRGSNNASMSFTISDKAKFTIVDGGTSTPQVDTAFPVSVADGTYKLVTIYVFSEFNKIENPTDLSKANPYKIYIYCADQDYKINDINLLSTNDNSELVSTSDGTFDYDPDTKDYTGSMFEVPYKNNSAILIEVDRNKLTSYISGHVTMDGVSYVDASGNMATTGTNAFTPTTNTSGSTITIKVQSEYAKLKSAVVSGYNGQTDTYKIKVRRAKASETNTLKSIKITIGSLVCNIPADLYTTYKYDATTGNVTKSVDVVTNSDGSLAESNKIIISGIDKNALQATVIATPTDKLSTVTGDINNVDLNLVDNSIQTLHIYVTPESADGGTSGRADYVIQIAREGVEFEGVNDISTVSMVDSINTEYLTGDNQFVSTKQSYGTATDPIIIPAAQSTVLFTISKKAPQSTVYQVDNGTDVLLSNDKKSYSNITAGTVYTFEFYCKAANATPGDHYKVYFKRAEYNKDATLKSLTVNGTSVKTNPFDPLTTFDKDQPNYTVYVTKDIEDAVLVGVPTATTSTIKSNDAASPVKLNEGSNVFVIVVQADDPDTTKSYTVNVIKDTDSSLESLEVLDDKGNNLITDFSNDKPNYTGIEVEYSNKTATFDYILTGTESLLTVELYKLVSGSETKINSPLAPQTLSTGKNTYILKITTQSKAVKSFRVEITRKAGKGDAYLTSYTTETGEELELIPDKFTYSYIVPVNITEYNPTYTRSEGAKITYKPTSTTINTGAKTRFQITVQSEDGETTNPYYFDVYCASTEFGVKDIQALTKATKGANIVDVVDDNYVQFNEANQVFKTGDTDYKYELQVAYSTENFYLKTVLQNDRSKLYVNGVPASDQSYELSDQQPNDFKIQVYSEYATIAGAPDADKYKSKEFTIRIIREEPNDNVDLKELSVVIGGKTYTLITNEVTQTSSDFKVSGNLFTIENVSATATSIKAYAEPVVPSPQTSMVASFATATANGKGYDYTDSLVTYNETDGTGYNFTYTVTVKGEGDNPEVKTYTIQVSRGVFNTEGYNGIHYITVVADGTEYFGMAQFDEDNAGPYDVEIPYISSQSYTINVYIPAVTKAAGETVYIDNVYQASGNKVVSFKYPTTGDYKKTHTVYGCNNDLEKGTEYTLNVVIAAPSKNAALAELSIDGDNIIDKFDSSGTYEYPTKYANDKEDPILVKVVAESELASITILRMNDTYATTGLGTAKANRTLKEGTQTLTITVTSQSGAAESYNVILYKNPPVPYLTNLEVPGEDLLDANNIKVEEFDPKTLEYKATVSYTTTSATINATVAAKNTNYTVTCKDMATTDGQVRAFPVQLNEGTNSFKINVTSPEGQTTTYTLTIKRRGVASTNTTISDINLVARETKDVLMETEDFDTEISEYYYTVPNDVRNVDVTLFNEAQANPDGATYRIINNTDLAVGNNEVIILVTSEDKKTSSAIIVNVEREPNQFDILAKEIEEFREDFTKDEVKDVYKVKSNISELNFTIYDRVTGKELTYEASGADNLKVGVETEVKLTIKAADGTFTTETLKVVREGMSYVVDKTAYAYACAEAFNAAQINTDTDKYYVINLGDKTADQIEDYTKYITELSEGATAKVISSPDSKASEVIVKVENSDGTEINYVHFRIETTANRGSLFDWLFWIILGLSVLILLIILICVNRDKYGSVSKKRKKAQ